MQHGVGSHARRGLMPLVDSSLARKPSSCRPSRLFAVGLPDRCTLCAWTTDDDCIMRCCWGPRDYVVGGWITGETVVDDCIVGRSLGGDRISDGAVTDDWTFFGLTLFG